MTDDSVRDPLALGLGSLVGGVGFGAVPMTVAQIWVGLNQEQYDLNGNLLLGSWLLSIGIGGMCGWYRSYHLDNVWQRGVVALLAAVGATLLGFVAAPIDKFFGPIGMIVWLLISIAVGIVATRWAINGIGQPPTPDAS